MFTAVTPNSLNFVLPCITGSQKERLMSLKRHLNDKQSPFRSLLEDCAPSLAASAGHSSASRKFAKQLGFYDLVNAPLVVPLPEEVRDKRRHSPTVGTAFDIRTRMQLGGFEPRRTASALGVKAANFMYPRLVADGERIAKVLMLSFLEAERLTSEGTDEDKDLASIIFSWCEAFHRAGTRVLRSSLGKLLQNSKTVESLFDSIPSGLLTDVSNLRVANQSQIEQWRKVIRSGAVYIGNPHFAGAYLVNGADGDWFIEDTLFDCKVVDMISAPWVRKSIMQLLGYLILDLDDEYKTARIGIWLPRQAMMKTWKLEEIIGNDAADVLLEARVAVPGLLE